jgi:hypothetical protein
MGKMNTAGNLQIKFITNLFELCYTVSDGTNTSSGTVTLDIVQGVHMFLPMLAR